MLGVGRAPPPSRAARSTLGSGSPPAHGERAGQPFMTKREQLPALPGPPEPQRSGRGHPGAGGATPGWAGSGPEWAGSGPYPAPLSTNKESGQGLAPEPWHGHVQEAGAGGYALVALGLAVSRLWRHGVTNQLPNHYEQEGPAISNPQPAAYCLHSSPAQCPEFSAQPSGKRKKS